MATTKPNILLIIADDLGVDTLRIDDTTDQVIVQLMGTAAYPLPNLSRMVSKGIHFTRTWAHPVCAPTRATLFSGLHPWRNGVGDAAGDPVLRAQLPNDGNADVKTLGHFVSAAGYRTCLLGKWDLGTDPTKTTPSARGWHRHEGILAGGLRFITVDPAKEPNYKLLIQHDVRYVSWAKVIGDVDSGFQDNIESEAREYKYATEDNVLSARNWIKQQIGKTPWWATLALLAPHDPFHVPPKGTFTIQFKDPAKPTDQEMFVAMMESMDYYLGKLFDDPDLQKQLANTIIIFMGDNGTPDELDEFRKDDKSSVYIGGVHVPLLIADGGAIFGDGPCYLDPSVISKENSNFVHVVDLFQTIIDMAGGTGPTAYKTDSITLLPYLKSATNEQFRRYSFGQFFVPPNDPALAVRYKLLGERATISDGTYKLNYQNGSYEFAELRHDPATDQTTETVTNQFQHPKAHELWQVLTTPGSPYYAEVDDKGRKFPSLPETGPQLLAVGMDHQLCYRETLTSNWVNVPNSGTVLGITVLPDGKILGIGTAANDLWYRETLTSNWVNVPNSGTVLGITALPDGKILGIGTGRDLWYRETLTSNWVNIPNSGTVLGITVLPDGKILGIGTAANDLWYRETLTSNWVNVPSSGAVLGITALPDGKILGIGTGRDLWYRETLTSNWVNVPSSDAVIGITYGGKVAIPTRMVAFGDVIRLKHKVTGLLLHSHSLYYRHPGTSGQQQVTCFGGGDTNDDWLIKGHDGQPEGFGKGEPIRHGSIVRLEHASTRRNLHSHANIPSPYTGQQEVTAFGDRIGNDSDNWRVEVEGESIAYTNKRIRLIHVNTNCALHSHNVPAYGDYTAGQQEVTCFGGRDDNDWWYFING